MERCRTNSTASMPSTISMAARASSSCSSTERSSPEPSPSPRALAGLSPPRSCSGELPLMRHLERRELAREVTLDIACRAAPEPGVETGRSKVGNAAAILRLGMLRLAAPRLIDSILIEPLRMSSDIEVRPCLCASDCARRGCPHPCRRRRGVSPRAAAGRRLSPRRAAPGPPRGSSRRPLPRRAAAEMPPAGCERSSRQSGPSVLSSSVGVVGGRPLGPRRVRRLCSRRQAPPCVPSAAAPYAPPAW
eukprot:scaffold24952_cov66-Phaeocystis_antarctica.AAC.4